MGSVLDIEDQKTRTRLDRAGDYLNVAILGEGGAPDEEEGRHHAEEHQGGQVELDEERIAVVRLEATFRLRLVVDGKGKEIG